MFYTRRQSTVAPQHENWEDPPLPNAQIKVKVISNDEELETDDGSSDDDSTAGYVE